MKKSASNLAKYRKTCHAVISRADNRCEALIDGARCGKYIAEAKWSNFLHRSTRNGKSDEWILDPSSVIFDCVSHHEAEERSGKRVEAVEYDDPDGIIYVPDNQ